MGLGKTLQVITLMLAAKQRGEGVEPSLVVCPTSVVLGWEREIARFAPELRVLCVIGDAATRAALLERAGEYDVLVTSYDMLKRDIALYEPMHFRYHILDEAQYIKNSTTQNARAVKLIRAAQRFALTGTPMENRLSELWSIFDFLMPGLLFSYTKFRARFEQPILRGQDARALERLGQMVSPFILRRLKRDVLTELPKKTERVLPATMDTAQRQVYLATLQELRGQLIGGGRLSGHSRMTVLAMLTRLRQICCDPRLCCEGYTGESCKLEACMELVREAADGGHKALLFSQFTSMLEFLRHRLEQEGIPYYLLQGSTPKEERARLVEAFNSDATPVFLISLKAGGTGLNLTGADVVIHYDPWWNLSVQNQATDRAYRIGQKNPVQVVRLIARDTVEERILHLQEDKWQLAESVVGVQGVPIEQMSAEELLAILG
jgi:SNF2 family DNA or RNA helicase